jgi:xanthine dehydrogenase iron-sulfur cluster and FAD-binding subunit A
MNLWDVYYTATSLDDAVRLLGEHGTDARIIAGGTDLIVLIQYGVLKPRAVIDITRVGGLDAIDLEGDGLIHLGPMVSHAQVASSPLLQERALPLAQASWWVGAPALRNRGTIAGNLVTASPANDTITALIALDAHVTVQSTRGIRTISLTEFYTGARQTLLAPDEMLVDIAFRPLDEREQGVYLKVGLRRVMAIAVTSVGVVLAWDDEGQVTDARIALGSVAPTVIRASEAEEAIIGGSLSDDQIAEAATRARDAALPIDDVRGSAWYRGEEVQALVRRSLELLRDAEREDAEDRRRNARGDSARGGILRGGILRSGILRPELPKPEDMVRLWGKTRRWPRLSGPTIAHHAGGDQPIQAVVNGENVMVHGANSKTLLQMLRQDLGLSGSKTGCEEGECGACTVWLDGIATLACLTPAPRAHGARILTIEGLSTPEGLHPLQETFVEEDAVQCGFCTPGFIMSAAKLLEEFPRPTRHQIKTALSGNLCRCTGYYKIISAVEKAAKR